MRKSQKLLFAKVKEKFSYDVDDLEAYTDEQGAEIITDLVYNSALISRINVMEGVKGSEKIKLLNADMELQSAETCGRTPDGAIVFADKTMTTKRVKTEMDLCNEDLVGTWPQLLLEIGANRQDKDIPFPDVLAAYTIKKGKLKNQNLMFKGDTTSLDPNLVHYDGFLKLWGADAVMLKYESLETEITEANSFGIFKGVHNKIPAVLFDNGIEVEIICSRADARKVIDRVWDEKDYNAKIEFKEENGELSFTLPTTNVTVRSYPQIPEGSVFAVPYRFMFYGTDLESDVDGFEAFYSVETEKIYAGAKWRSGVNYVYSDYFVKLVLAAS